MSNKLVIKLDDKWKFAAQDRDGAVFTHTNLPKVDDQWCWTETDCAHEHLRQTLGEVNEDWKDSLVHLLSHDAYVENGLLKSRPKAPAPVPQNNMVSVFAEWVNRGCPRETVQRYVGGVNEWVYCGTHTPWDPNHKYRIKPEQEETPKAPTIRVRTYLARMCDDSIAVLKIQKGKQDPPQFVQYIEGTDAFIRWLDNDWVEVSGKPAEIRNDSLWPDGKVMDCKGNWVLLSTGGARATWKDISPPGM